MKEKPKHRQGRIYIVMGVSGCGKSTIAPLLSERLSLPFFDGDNFHPEENVRKMSARIPLTDDDRHNWLVTLNQLALKNSDKGAVIVCSALKKSYRQKLSQGLEGQMIWVFLKGTYELILSRLQSRKGHFMPTSLLRSQFETLEIPESAITVCINGTPETIVNDILANLRDIP
jgi:gluconokinase